MNSFPSTKPQRICEDILLEEIRQNNELGILPSENRVAHKLMTRGIELKDAYAELYDKLHARPQALQSFLQVVLTTAAFWNPDDIQEARNSRAELANLNQQIARKAGQLAKLLEQRSDLHDTSGFNSNTHYHVCKVIEAAAAQNHRFRSYVHDRFRPLHSQFDLKYWPSLADFLLELASDAEKAVIEPTDPITAAATTAVRASLADFFKALFAAIEENRVENYGQFPKGFKLTDRTLASLANCALGLGPDDLVDDGYVKRLRQRERNSPK